VSGFPLKVDPMQENHFGLLAGVVLAAGLLVPSAPRAAVPDAAQPGKSVFTSLYGVPGAGLSLDAKYWERVGVGVSFTGGRTAIYPGYTDDAAGEEFVLETYVDVMIASSPGVPAPGTYGVAFIGGVWVTGGVQRPLIGVCGAYWFDSRVIMRGNAVYGPSAGIELAYVLARNLEATLTVLSGRGMLGLRFGLVEPHPFTHDVDELAAGR